MDKQELLNLALKGYGDEIKKMKDLYHRVSEILSVDDFGPNEFGKQ